MQLFHRFKLSIRANTNERNIPRYRLFVSIWDQHDKVDNIVPMIFASVPYRTEVLKAPLDFWTKIKVGRVVWLNAL